MNKELAINKGLIVGKDEPDYIQLYVSSWEREYITDFHYNDYGSVAALKFINIE